MLIKKLTICGGGNGAHVLLALLAKRCDYQLILYLNYGNELYRFQETKENKTPLRCIFNGEEDLVSIDRVSITQDPKKAAASDIVVLVLPAFAHESILNALAPFLQPGTVLVALPAKGGFEFQVGGILERYDCKGVLVAGVQTLPWACRIKEYARSVEIYGQKKKVGVATLLPHYSKDVALIFNGLLKLEFLPYNNMLELTLGNQGQIIHPGIMFGGFVNKLDTFYSENNVPLFYESVNEEIADLLKNMSNEILRIKEVIKNGFDIELDGVLPIGQWTMESYGDDIEDKTTLARMFQTNRSYQSLRVPVKPIDGSYQIDVRSRYLTEDIPYGLLVSKAIAKLADVATPRIDEVIEETSRWVGVQYMIDGKLGGKDLARTRIPQNFGLKSMESIIKIVAKSH